MGEEHHEAEEPSLDQLSQAFAEAMSRTRGTDRSEPSASGDAAGPPGGATGAADAAVTEPAATEDTTPISPKTILEAILFVGHPENEPLQGAAIAKLLRGVQEEEVDQLVTELNNEYDGSGMPMRVGVTAEGMRLELREAFEFVRQRFYGRVRKGRLSQMAVDVLAVVAYHQPVTREQVDKLLNFPEAKSGRVLNLLVRRELLAVVLGEDKSRHRQYVTTERFLELFGLDDLADLPRGKEPQ